MPNIKISWLITGQFLFGLLIGVLVGLSLSPVVGTVLGLLFAFIGGSIIVLIQGRTDEELALIGKSVAAVSISMLIGVSAGIVTRSNDLLSFLDKNNQTTDFTEQLSFEDIKSIGPKKRYARIICSIIKTNRTKASPLTISKKQLSELIDANVEPLVLQAAIGHDIDCFYNEKNSTSKVKSGSHLFVDSKPKGGQDRDATPIP